MAIISEEEAKQFKDLYDFEIWCIDFLQGIKDLRQQSAPNEDTEFTREVAIESGQSIAAKIPELLKEITL